MLARVLLVAWIMGLLAACAPVAARPVAHEAQETILFLISGDPADEAAYRTLVDAFMAADPTVQVDLLNVRSGPGLEYAPITQVYSGESLPIAGKDTEACNWVFVAYSNLAGWVAAAPQYVALDRPCNELVVLTPQEIDAWQSGVE